jgi:hypothetical protein
MTFLIVTALLIGACGVARLLLGEFAKAWYENVENSYTTCDNFHATMAARPGYVKANEWLEGKGI